MLLHDLPRSLSRSPSISLPELPRSLSHDLPRSLAHDLPRSPVGRESATRRRQRRAATSASGKRYETTAPSTAAPLPQPPFPQPNLAHRPPPPQLSPGAVSIACMRHAGMDELGWARLPLRHSSRCHSVLRSRAAGEISPQPPHTTSPRPPHTTSTRPPHDFPTTSIRSHHDLRTPPSGSPRRLKPSALPSRPPSPSPTKTARGRSRATSCARGRATAS